MRGIITVVLTLMLVGLLVPGTGANHAHGTSQNYIAGLTYTVNTNSGHTGYNNVDLWASDSLFGSGSVALVACVIEFGQSTCNLPLPGSSGLLGEVCWDGGQMTLWGNNIVGVRFMVYPAYVDDPLYVCGGSEGFVDISFYTW